MAALVALVLAVFAWRSLVPRDRVQMLQIRASPEFWRDNGYVEMVPPLRLPGRAARELSTSVWLRLPEHGLLSVGTDAETERPLLHYPEGTQAVRVEVWQSSTAHGEAASYVADARGVRFSSANAQQFFVLKPGSAGHREALLGFSWPRADLQAHARATQLLSELSEKSLAPQEAERAAARVRAQNACPECHVLARADAHRVREFGEVARGTDGDGLFQIQTVLSDHEPIESYAPREQNLDDPAIEVRCGSQPALRNSSPAGTVFACADHTLPIGYLDVPRAMAAKDARVQGLCRARQYLFEHLDARGRASFRDAFRACRIQ